MDFQQSQNFHCALFRCVVCVWGGRSLGFLKLISFDGHNFLFSFRLKKYFSACTLRCHPIFPDNTLLSENKSPLVFSVLRQLAYKQIYASGAGPHSRTVRGTGGKKKILGKGAEPDGEELRGAFENVFRRLYSAGEPDSRVSSAGALSHGGLNGLGVV